MNNIEKPAFLSEIDWQIVKEKYKDNLKETIKKLQDHYPVQYLIGNVEFYNSIINVDPRVLIPRFETEQFVEKLLLKIKKYPLAKQRCIDLGTGSGCIAISIQKELNNEVTAVDISKDALAVAKINGMQNQTKITWIEDSIENISLENYDIIVSNPPYVSKIEPTGEETKYEPQNALFAEEEGTYYYHQIIKKVSSLQAKPLLIAFEIGKTQRKSITKLVETYLPNYQITIEKDYANCDRFAWIEKKSE